MASPKKPKARASKSRGVRTTAEPPKRNWLGILAALATIVGLPVAIYQVWSFVQTERAVLNVIRLELVNGLVARQPIVPRGTILNGGKSVAYLEKGNVTVKITTQGLTQLPPEPDYRGIGYSPPGNIPPGGTGQFTSDMLDDKGRPLVLNEYNISLFGTGDKVLHVYGYVSYRDRYSVFGDMISGYCFVYVPKATPNFQPCKERSYTYTR